MKNGKVSESILKRSVFKQLHMRNDKVILGPAVGADSSVVKLSGDEDAFAVSTTTVTTEFAAGVLTAKAGVHGAVNNVLASGAKPVGVVVDVLVPTVANESQLRELMRDIDSVCEEAGISVLGGHTQVTRAVKDMVITVTAFGTLLEENLPAGNRVTPGMDIILTKWVGLEGTAMLAIEKSDELCERYSAPFVDKAKAFIDYLSIESEAAVATKSGAVAMHDVSEGGVFAALWELAESSGVGLDIDLKKIPIRQETVEICEFFDINPYKLLGGGALLIAAEDGNNMVREIEAAGGMATIIGVTTDSNDRVLIQGEERRFLETAQTDELYSVIK